MQKQEQNNHVLVAYLLRRVSELSLENQSLRDLRTLETPPELKFQSNRDLSASVEKEISTPESSQEFPDRWTSEGETSESNSSEIEESLARHPKSWWGDQEENRDAPETGKVSSPMDPPLTRFKNSPDKKRFCEMVSGDSNHFPHQDDSAFDLWNLKQEVAKKSKGCAKTSIVKSSAVSDSLIAERHLRKKSLCQRNSLMTTWTANVPSCLPTVQMTTAEWTGANL